MTQQEILKKIEELYIDLWCSINKTEKERWLCWVSLEGWTHSNSTNKLYLSHYIYDAPLKETLLSKLQKQCKYFGDFYDGD